jgi:hypothetical protein
MSFASRQPEAQTAVVSTDQTNSDRFLILAPIFLLATLDLFTLIRNHTEAEDSAGFIVGVTNGEHVFLPNHLLFGAINRLHYLAWTFFGYSGNATIPMQLISVVASLLSIYLIYRIARRIGIPTLLSLTCAGWSAFAFGFWVYSLEAVTYNLPIPFMLCSVQLLLGMQRSDFEAPAGDLPRLVALGALSAAAAALHQQYVFLMLVVVLVLTLMWQQTPQRALSVLATKVMVYLSTAGALLGGAYIAVGSLVFGHRNVLETIRWARGYAAHGMWEPLSLKTPLLTAVGVARSIFGVNFLLYPPWLAAAIARSFSGKDTIEKRYLAASAFGWLDFTVIAVATVVAIAVLAFFLVRILRSRHEYGLQAPLSPSWIFTRFAVVYLCVYIPLIALWEPENPQFWVGLTPIFAILLASRLPAQRPVMYAGFLLVVTLFVANLLGAVLPYHSASTEYWNVQNKGFVGLAGKGDLILTHCPHRCREALALTTGAKVLDSFSDEVDELTPMLSPSARGHVFVSSWGLYPDTIPVGVRFSGERFEDKGVLKMLQTMRDRLVLAGHSGEQSIWSIRTDPRS